MRKQLQTKNTRRSRGNAEGWEMRAGATGLKQKLLLNFEQRCSVALTKFNYQQEPRQIRQICHCFL